ncbi:sulfate adenylyltransferase, large subunit [Candidatus Methanoperedens nitroreducens]|uniref:sulfate adenylyltransferase n=1 Tax=Candidatus Methanoperedens nitratireducens TaxID=1392998 RepID=A0A062V5E2_9EURY|nr:GTP-binding protein [Candidatus Methanoperedens nitroreducens]KCZ70625.1 sulfate adenylyltransferase, large subunit [Candidatus Methanoperedens nitroreducens]MDJ1420481.1 GTP-binding protein [Candidatus Methanoperedens sp.]
MNNENLKFVIVGHVDHGKSTLIGRLLYDTGSLPEGKIEEIKQICESLGREIEFGYVMDHLEEERDQGITIDTAQTFFNTEKRNYVIIDAPGHVEFVKNMISGASQAEAAVLIVDVEEGVREQTKRHAYILGMLGLSQVIVVVNKMDLINYDQKRFESVKKDILKFLLDISIKPSYVIPISAKKGDFIANKISKMNWYDGPTLLEALDIFKTKESANYKPLRFVVQDIYNFDKRIIVGRVESGVIKKGDKIKILPSGEETRVKSIEEYLKNVTEAEAGKSIGITTEDKLFIDRGNVVIHNGDMPAVTDRIMANVFWMDRTPFKIGERLMFRCSTQEVSCEVEKINRVINSSTLELIAEDATEIKNREVANIVIRTDKPVVVENFNKIEELGRFVLGREDTCAGGIITEPEQ